MNKFESLIKYLPLLDDNIGTWVIDRENDGTPEFPIQMPFVDYSEIVHHFIEDVYDFNNKNKEFELSRYGEILEKKRNKMGFKVHERSKCFRFRRSMRYGIDYGCCACRAFL